MSSDSTALCGASLKRPVPAPVVAVLTCDPWPPVSEEPAVSMMRICGR